MQQKIKHISENWSGKKVKRIRLNLGVIGSFMYARMLETGSSNGPSTKVPFNLPSYSNLLNMSCREFHFVINNQCERLLAKRHRNTKQSHACNDITMLGSNGGASDTVFARNIGLREENGT